MRETPRNGPVLTVLARPADLVETPFPVENYTAVPISIDVLPPVSNGELPPSPVHDYTPVPIALDEPPPPYDDALRPPSYGECTANCTNNSK